MLFDALTWLLFPGLFLWSVFTGFVMFFGAIAYAAWTTLIKPTWSAWRQGRVPRITDWRRFKRFWWEATRAQDR